jgi:hypothetical protein
VGVAPEGTGRVAGAAGRPVGRILACAQETTQTVAAAQTPITRIAPTTGSQRDVRIASPK